MFTYVSHVIPLSEERENGGVNRNTPNKGWQKL